MQPPKIMRSILNLIGLSLFSTAALQAQSASVPANLPAQNWHLTARPWTPLNTPRTDILDKVEDIIGALAPLQYWNASTPGDVQDGGDVQNGAIIDMFEFTEWQYATPYFTFSAATLAEAGRKAGFPTTQDLVEAGARALDHATADIAGLDGSNSANQSHGEFFGAPMTKALRLYKSMQATYPTILTAARIARWESRMTVSRASYMNGNGNNWRTYGMKGEWLRAKDGLVPKTGNSSQGVPWIESSWLSQSQRERFVRDQVTHGLNPYFYAYHDDDYTGKQNFAYLGGSAGNLLDMIHQGYDGPSAGDLKNVLMHAARSAMLMMSGNGESPAGGRTGNHIWNDIVFANLFEMAAEISWQDGNKEIAGQYRRAARLAFESSKRFQQEEGWFSVTKNLFHSHKQNRYASWSGLTNYNGYTHIHSSEAYATRLTNIPEQPAPAEIGGYVMNMDHQFHTTFANAGGMQVQISTNGSQSGSSSGGQRWFVQGIQRFSRPGWDSRLGPGDGWINNAGNSAISFAPAFFEGGAWKQVAEQPDRYTSTFSSSFVHPLLVRGKLAITPKSGQSGPNFDMDLVITPDGVLVDTSRTSGSEDFGVIWPVLEHDGKHKLVTSTTSHIASTAYSRQSATKTTLEAENASLTGGVTTSTTEPNYTGTAYAEFPSSGGAIQWSNVNGGDGGSATIGFRYTLAQSTATSRTVTLRINGVAQTITLDHTGNHNTYNSVLDQPMVWHQLHFPVALTAGATNTIRLEAGSAGGLNIDEMRVFPADSAQGESDQQNFISLDSTPTVDTSTATRRTGYGDQRPIRVTNSDAAVSTFVYPRSAGDPTAESVRTSFTRSGADFTTSLGRIEGNLYVGRTSAGGEGTGIDLDNDSTDDVTFSANCAFVLQLNAGTVTHIEADRFVDVTIGGKTVKLAPYTPIQWNQAGANMNNIQLDAAGQQFEVTLNFTPANNTSETLTGFSDGGASTSTDLLAAIRFGDDGKITPVSGATLTDFDYTGGVSHQIRALFDLADGSVSVWVKPAGGTERRVIANADLPANIDTPEEISSFSYFTGNASSSATSVTSYGPLLDIKINFQDGTSAGFPGYLSDTGLAYADRGNGHNYGWIDGVNTALARNRNNAASADERYDTFNHMSYNNPPTETHTWEIALPNGAYTVKVVCGDASYSDSNFQILGEGTTIVQGNADTTGTHWFEGTAQITVADGRLTLTNGAGSYRNKICFIEITSVASTFPGARYENWADQHFAGGITNPDADPAQDPDEDGLNNQLERALGGDPNTHESAASLYNLVQPATIASPQFRFFRVANFLDVNYSVWESNDLSNWSLVWSYNDDIDFTSGTATTPSPSSDGWVTVTLPTLTSAKRRFVQLRIDSY